MSPLTWQRVKEIYTAARELPSAERTAFIEEMARDAPRVRDEALRLLSLDEGAETRIGALRMPEQLLQFAGDRRAFFPGERLAGRYEILRFLARGGMGEVYEADDLERGERIAIKVLRPELATEQQVAWLRREVAAARRIQHPNVCRVFDLVETGKTAFLTMELLPGETLAAYLRREGALNERRAAPWIRQMVAGLAAAHAAGVVHRDFKPGNVMLVPRLDGPPRAVIMDFGLARHSPADRQTTLSMDMASAMAAAGTPAYMAPEQIEGKRAGAAADIYALGAVIFEMVTGELPFPADSPLSMAVRKTREEPPSARVHSPALRASWDAAIRRCLQANPARRFGDVRRVLAALESRSPRLWRWRVFKRAAVRQLSLHRLAAIGALALVFLAWASWRVWPATPSQPQREAWERAILALQSGEPLPAIQALEAEAARMTKPPARWHVDLALAWHEAGLPARAQAALAAALPRWLLPYSDRRYLDAARARLAGQPAEAANLLRERVGAAPNDAMLLADLAWFEGGPAVDRWRRVAALRPDHAAAHLYLAEAAATAADWRTALAEFQLAQLYFQTRRMPELVKAVAARRATHRIRAGQYEDAVREDLAGSVSLQAHQVAGACQHVTVIVAGIPDGFAGSTEPVPALSPKFRLFPAYSPNRPLREFDQTAVDHEFFFSLPLPPVRICSGKVELRVRRDLPGYHNDSLILGAAPFANQLVERIVLWAEYPEAVERTIAFDLQAKLFAEIMRAYVDDPVPHLDVYAGDDTAIDYFKLTIVY